MKDTTKSILLAQLMNLLPRIPKTGVPPFAHISIGSKVEGARIMEKFLKGNCGLSKKDADAFISDYVLVNNEDPYGIQIVINQLTGRVINKVNPGVGLSNGRIGIEAYGGVSPYTFKLDAGVAQNSGLFGNVGAGNHTVKITDDDGTTYDVVVELVEEA